MGSQEFAAQRSHEESEEPVLLKHTSLFEPSVMWALAQLQLWLALLVEVDHV